MSNELPDNEVLDNEPDCLPPKYFLVVYEEAWEQAFGKNKQWAHDSTAGGTFNVRRRAFREVAKDMRGLDDIAVMDNLFRALAASVRAEAHRRQDRANWHETVEEMIRQLRENRP